MSDWLDLELSHHLRPTEAPPELWNRIGQSLDLPARRTSTVRADTCPSPPS